MFTLVTVLILVARYMWLSTVITLLGMELMFQSDGSNSDTSKCALALLHMNGIVTPAWRLIAQLETAVSSSTSQGMPTLHGMAVTRSTGKSLIAMAGML